MNPSDTTSINPRDDGTNKASQMDQDPPKPVPQGDPKPASKGNPGPDSSEAVTTRN